MPPEEVSTTFRDCWAPGRGLRQVKKELRIILSDNGDIKCLPECTRDPGETIYPGETTLIRSLQDFCCGHRSHGKSAMNRMIRNLRTILRNKHNDNRLFVADARPQGTKIVA